MNPRIAAALALAAAFALPPPAAAQADFLAAPKVACAPESVTRCTAADQCTTRAASARDKTEVLVIDFGGKKAAVRRADGMKPFADIVEDQVSGEQRRFSLVESGSGGGERLAAALSRAGKLTLVLDKAGSKAEATCTVES